MTDDRPSALARALGDFRRRQEAMYELVDCGDDAVPALREALASVREGARWGAAKCLTTIGTPAALEALVDALGPGPAGAAAAEALRSVTGEDFGDDAQAWRQHLSQLKGIPRKGFDVNELVEKAMEPLDVDVKQTRHGWILDLKFAKGRHQVVKVACGKTDEEGAAIVIVYSECGPATPDRYEWALRKNMSIPYGAIAIREVDGEPTFIVFNTLLEQDLSPGGLRKTVQTVAERADAMENEFTGMDQR